MKINEATPRLATFVMAASLFLFLTSTSRAQFSYITTNGTITITGYTGSDGSVDIPSAIGGLLVTRIGDSAFLEKNVTNVTIPETVTSLGVAAFSECTALTSVSISNGLTSIED